MNDGIDGLGNDDIVKVVMKKGVCEEREEVILKGSVESSRREDLVDEHLKDSLFEEKEIEGHIQV